MQGRVKYPARRFNLVFKGLRTFRIHFPAELVAPDAVEFDIATDELASVRYGAHEPGRIVFAEYREDLAKISHFGDDNIGWFTRTLLAQPGCQVGMSGCGVEIALAVKAPQETHEVLTCNPDRDEQKGRGKVKMGVPVALCKQGYHEDHQNKEYRRSPLGPAFTALKPAEDRNQRDGQKQHRPRSQVRKRSARHQGLGGQRLQ